MKNEKINNHLTEKIPQEEVVKEYKDRKECFLNGLLHRDNDLPAVEIFNGTKEWYQYGKRHRDNGPALEYLLGANVKVWYQNDKIHRTDGPALESRDTKQWYINGEKHREDGPAIEETGGRKEWYLYGVKKTEEEFNRWVEKKNLKEKLEQEWEEKPKGKNPKI